MILPLVLADIAPLPEIILGGSVLATVFGVFLSIFVAGIIRRKRSRDESELKKK